ncbi:Glycerate 3-kinase [Nocardioides sp. T2.26MG-1]|nr:Glycerate 3-kinase [Nocardioides sp. T2.26MG-1]
MVAALDSFKGSLDSAAAGWAVRDGVLAADPTAAVVVHAVADGGEGTLAALLGGGGREVPVDTVDAIGRPVTAAIGLLDHDGRRTAVVEAARTIGLAGVGVVDSALPPRASSYGVGLQVRAALELGVDRVLVALGGTASTDGGAGMLAALGAELVDATGRRLDPADGNPLWHGALLGPGSLPATDAELCVLTDVRNPLAGVDGAATVFGPQKGATPEQVRLLEGRMTAWARSLGDAAPGPIATVPGAGAAGGLAAALLALGARLEPGFARVAAETDLAGALVGADLVVTGEGSLDAQTAWGKTPAGVARLARAAGAVVVALGGRVERPTAGGLFDAVLPIHSRPRPLSEAMDPAVTADELAATAGEVVRLVTAARLGWARDR